MAKLIYHIAVTADNFIADLDGDATDSIFLYEGEHVLDFITDVQQYDAVLMGRRTYEFGFQFGAKPGEPGYFKELKHYICSNTMQFESSDKVELVRGDAVEFIKNLKVKEVGNLWLCGGGELAGSLVQQKLIDQVVLKINPVIIGEGIPLFGSVKPRLSLELVDSTQYVNGVIKSTYNIMYS
ncbi:dihydrofolate reductase family protein [Bacillus sp. XF8]|uniref:dihydrofolate reductase family protein n=1 Tax=Bacillus sp. XF8 TaxID=2819289 RepID=UPI001AA07642|nr:dihydrofolate reductase family protein [Bacillus sp. XF8]MBO1580822.1 dihydrofolate reductase family protein [Bacillus sp. XF8]